MRRRAGCIAVVLCCWVMLRAGAAAAEPSQSPGIDQTPGTDQTRGVVTTRGPAELVTYRWDFSRSTDRNFDGWPDGWERHRGPRHPNYVDVAIEPIDTAWATAADRIDTTLLLRWSTIRRWAPMLPRIAPSIADQTVSRCLAVELDGGLAAVSSPPVPCQRSYQYRLQTRIETNGLRHDTARVELQFEDASGQTLDVTVGPAVGGSQIRDVVISPISPPPGTTAMRLRLRVAGGPEGREDVRGRIRFHPIAVGQYPQLTISTGDPLAVHRVGQPITATVQMVGGIAGATTLALRLTDQHERVVASAERRVTAADVPIEWSLGTLSPGWYRVAAAVSGPAGVSLATRSGLSVLEDLSRLQADRRLRPRGWITADPTASSGQIASSSQSPEASLNSGYGMTLPTAMLESLVAGRLSVQRIADWVVQGGSGQAKIPLWLAAGNDTGRRAAARLAVALRDRGVEPVGLLDRPPPADIAAYQPPGQSRGGVSGWLAEPARWEPLLAETFEKLAPSVRTWQIGGDEDDSHVGGFQTESSLERIAMIIRGFGPRIGLATPWPWLEPAPVKKNQDGVWRTLQRFSQPPLTAAEMLASMPPAAGGPDSQSKRAFTTWINLAPLDNRRYRDDDRAIDLVARMAATRRWDDTTAFGGSTDDSTAGLVTADLKPTALWTVWRTTATLLAATRWEGRLPLPEGSLGDLYAREGWSVSIVSSDQPTIQRLHLGGNVVAVDIWGQISDVPTELHHGRQVHRFVTGPVPLFLVGVDLDLAAFRRSVQLDRRRLDVITGEPQRFRVLFENPTEQPLSGQLAVLTPNTWQRDRQPDQWSIRSRGIGEHPVAVTLAGDATVGSIDLPIYFRFDRPSTSEPADWQVAAASRTIRIDRPLEVGPKGFDVVITTRLIGDVLRVTIKITNRTATPASFDTLLFAGTDRQYQRRVVATGPNQTTDAFFDWPGGASLVGQSMTLRAMQQEDRRVINQVFEASR